ncbi:hypothetical protein ACIBQ6_36435 [Nonomuraea sp. NPDC049655]|uniref:hypothetical protein n=1 Tax=Nonomuraea sp. NPDC049655 TaxID=3364355 RepID=UPI0037986C59
MEISLSSMTSRSNQVGVRLPLIEISSPAVATLWPPAPSTSWMSRLRRVTLASLPESLAYRLTPVR